MEGERVQQGHRLLLRDQMTGTLQMGIGRREEARSQSRWGWQHSEVPSMSARDMDGTSALDRSVGEEA